VKFNESRLIIEKKAFLRETIIKRMEGLEFNNISRFELFLWDLEIFLQIQRRIGDNIILKGGAATQFYIPVENQRTSVDIDMICTCSEEEVIRALVEIEDELNGEDDLFKFKEYTPQKPKVELKYLKTYFVKVPTICVKNELYITHGVQEVKVEFLFSTDTYKINKIKSPELFAVETEHSFNILTLSSLFGDKLTTLGPKTVGITEDRMDELFKQIYDIITLFESNKQSIILNFISIKRHYEKVAKVQCEMRNIKFDKKILRDDMAKLIKRIQKIEEDGQLLQYANNFQSLYLRKNVNRSKTDWAIVGIKLEMLCNKIFKGINYIDSYLEIDEFIEYIGFLDIKGPERGVKINGVRKRLQDKFGQVSIESQNLFRKRLDRVIWELLINVKIEDIKGTIV